MKNEVLHNIQFVSKVTGINIHTLRVWEKRYKAVVPKRDENGRRTYSQVEVDRLSMLQELSTLGNSISMIAKLSDIELKALHQQYIPKTNNSTQIEEFDYDRILQNLIFALKAFKLDIINHELSKLSINLNIKDFINKLIVPLLNEVGNQVYTGQMSIGQEHSLSSILKFHVTKFIYSENKKDKKNKKTIIITTPEGELHEFGILLSALICNYHNHNVVYLGPNMPKNALNTTAKELNADLIILGISQFSSSENKLKMEKYINDLSNLTQSSIIVGGSVNELVLNENITKINSISNLEGNL